MWGDGVESVQRSSRKWEREQDTKQLLKTGRWIRKKSFEAHFPQAPILYVFFSMLIKS